MMKDLILTLAGLLVISTQPAWSLEDSMKQMPKLKPKSTYAIENNKTGEDLLDQRGFGNDEPMVRMMNLMMVEGSGMEGMDMGHMQMARNEMPTTPPANSSNYKFNVNSPKALKVGKNEITIAITDTKSGRPAKGLKLKSQVYMTSMDMGTEEPPVREISPGQYQVKAGFSMKGPWAVKLTLGAEEKIFEFNVEASH